MVQVWNIFFFDLREELDRLVATKAQLTPDCIWKGEQRYSKVPILIETPWLPPFFRDAKEQNNISQYSKEITLKQCHWNSLNDKVKNTYKIWKGLKIFLGNTKTNIFAAAAVVVVQDIWSCLGSIMKSWSVTPMIQGPHSTQLLRALLLWVQVLGVPLTICATLSKLLNLPVLQFVWKVTTLIVSFFLPAYYET